MHAATGNAPNINAERRPSGGVAPGVSGFTRAEIKVVALNTSHRPQKP
jgi:hypothetical protein